MNNLPRAKVSGVGRVTASQAGMDEYRAGMLEHNGRVISATPTSVLIETERQSACGHCGIGEDCGTSVFARLFSQRTNRVRLANTLDGQGQSLQAGDEVVIGIPEQRLLRAAMWAYLVPMVSMIFFALIAEMAGYTDIDVFFASVVGLINGLYLSRVVHAHRAADEIVLLHKRTPDTVMASLVTTNINIT